MDFVWLLIGLLGLVGFVYSWLLLVIAILWGISRHRGPHHYTKHMVPDAYRFKWDAWWIIIACLAPLCAFMLFANYKVNAEMGIWAWITAFVIGLSLLRVVIWLCFRFPLTSWFFVNFIAALTGGSRGRRRW